MQINALMATVMSSTLEAPSNRNYNGLQVPSDPKRRRVISETLTEIGPGQNAPAAAAQQCRISLCWEEFGGNLVFSRCQPLHFAWREIESQIPSTVFNLSFDNSLEIEKSRVAGIDSIFNYVLHQDLSQTTLHLAAHYINKLFLYNEQKLQQLKSDNFALWISTATTTAIRTAVKMQEKPENTESFRSLPGQLWEISNVPMKCSIEKSIELVNQMERLHLRIIGQTPVHIPVASDFLNQYIIVGEWPEPSAAEYRQLGLFLLAMSLYATGRHNSLKGKTPSILAAGALVLSVKIINTNQKSTAYEFWPSKLEAFSQYTINDLQPLIRSLSKLLRDRQKQIRGECLERMFPYWGRFVWN